MFLRRFPSQSSSTTRVTAIFAAAHHALTVAVGSIAFEYSVSTSSWPSETNEKTSVRLVFSDPVKAIFWVHFIEERENEELPTLSTDGTNATTCSIRSRM